MFVPIPASQAELNELFYIEDGKLYNKISRANNKVKAGTEAGSIRPDGYRTVRVGNRQCLTHRVMYKMQFGYEPPEVDHPDLDRGNDRYIRGAAKSENKCNTNTYANNITGIKGLSTVVLKGKRYYVASITKDGKRSTKTKLATEENREQLISWLNEMRDKLHGAFANRGNNEYNSRNA